MTRISRPCKWTSMMMQVINSLMVTPSHLRLSNMCPKTNFYATRFSQDNT